MKTYKLRILFFAICASLLFVQCDDDDNGNVIEQATCDDGLQNGDETGVDCGGTACEPCVEELDFSGTYTQEDHMGRPGINTVFSGTDALKNNFNTTITSGRGDFQDDFEARLELYHDVYGDALGADIDYETNILGLDATTFTFVLANTDALQVAPQGPTSYFIPGGVALTGRTLDDDVIDVSLTLMFGGMTGTRFDGNNGTPQLTSDGVGFGDRVIGAFPYMESPNN
jgi:hypothetical protein